MSKDIKAGVIYSAVIIIDAELSELKFNISKEINEYRLLIRFCRY